MSRLCAKLEQQVCNMQQSRVERTQRALEPHLSTPEAPTRYALCSPLNTAPATSTSQSATDAISSTRC